jgi:hypothetical protein
MLDKKPYITGAEKFPLEIRRDGPQIGVLSQAQDKYFAQTSIPGLVKQDHTVWRLITDDIRGDEKKKGDVAVSGFLRIAVDNRKRVQAESFLASVAPILGFNSTQELKNDMFNKINLRLFMQLNYGNLLLEFYDPNFKLPGYNPVKQKEYLSTFIKDNLQIAETEAKQAQLLRDQEIKDIEQGFISDDRFYPVGLNKDELINPEGAGF